MAIVYQRVSTPITNPDQGVDAMGFHIIWVLKSAAASLLWAGVGGRRPRCRLGGLAFRTMAAWGARNDHDWKSWGTDRW